MPKFIGKSLAQLQTCDPRLVGLFQEVVKHFDCSVLCGHRGEEAQNLACATGKSQKRWPNSKHNTSPAIAVDVVPYPIDWKDLSRFIYFAGFVKGIAASMGLKIRWGGDFNMNQQLKDEKFKDYPHFELIL